MSRGPALPRRLALLVAAVLSVGLAACGADHADAKNDAVAAAASSTSTPSSGEGEEDSYRATGTEAWLNWKPTTVIQPRTFTTEEANKLRLDWLEANRPDEAQGLPIPELVAWTNENDGAKVECLRANGFNAWQEDPSDGITAETPTKAQEVRFDIVSWQCNAQYTPIPPKLSEANREQENRVWFQYFRDFYLDCLEDNFDVHLDRSKVPSEESWVARVTSHNPGEDLWYPPDQLSWPDTEVRKTPPDWQKTCPHFPPAHVMFGEWKIVDDPQG